MPVKIKEDEDFSDEEFSDKWTTYRYLTKVESDIKEEITSDFILAKLTDNQKEAVIELVRDAYFCKKEIEKLKKGCRYKPMENGEFMRNEDGTYRKFTISNIEQKYIENLGRITFNAYMVKIIMTVIMYRNIEQNVLMELITEKDRLNAESEELKRENENLIERAKKNIKKGGKEDE